MRGVNVCARIVSGNEKPSLGMALVEIFHNVSNEKISQ